MAIDVKTGRSYGPAYYLFMRSEEDEKNPLKAWQQINEDFDILGF